MTTPLTGEELRVLVQARDIALAKNHTAAHQAIKHRPARAPGIPGRYQLRRR